LRKQRRYDEGIQRIQSSIDRVAGLDIARDVDKQYLQGKLDDLGNKLKFVAAGDFSDFQLVNSVTGMTSRIGKDETVQNAVISTARYRSEVEKMETDRGEGILDPSNEFFFSKQADQWINNPNAGASFKGKYVPHFDVFGFAKETFNEVKPDGMTFDQVFQMDAEGNPIKDEKGNLVYSTYMTRLEKEGIFPEKVKATIGQIFSDPRVSQQLNISGQYNYKDYNSDDLSQIISRQKGTIVAGYNEEINKNLLRKGTAKTGEEKEQIQQVIDKLRTERSQVGQTYDSYTQQAYDNPDAVRAQLYKDDVRSRYTTMFGHMKSSTKIMDSPPYRVMFDLQKEANVNNRWYQDHVQRDRFHQDDMIMKQATLNAKNKEEQESFGREWSTAKVDSDLDRIRFAKNRYDKAASNFRSSSDDFIWEMIFANDDTGYYNNRLATLKAREGVDDHGAIGIIIAEEAQKAGRPVEEYKTEWLSQAMSTYENMSPEEKAKNYIASRKYENYRSSKRDFETEQDNRAMINEVLAEDNMRIGQELSLLDVQPQTITVSGKEVNLTAEDIYDLATYANASTDLIIGKNKEQRNKIKQDANDAVERLKQRGKGDVFEHFWKDNATGGSKVARGIRRVGEALSPVKDLNKTDWSQVFGVIDVLNSGEYDEILEKQGEVIQRIYSMTPPQATPLLTGDTETDRDYVNKIASFAGVYKQGQSKNASPDFKGFNVDLASPQSNNFTIHTSRTDGDLKTEIVQYDENNERVGGMTITPEQANQLNIDVNNLFESPEIVSLRNRITRRGGKTSVGDISSKTTYLGDGDYYYGKGDLPKLSGSPVYDAKVNIREYGGVFYPYVYINNGEKDRVVQLQGSSHLQNLITTLKNELSPALIDKFLSER
jgi:hypothetical protein